MRVRSLLTSVVAIVLLATTTAYAQSFVKLAHNELERRKVIARAGRTVSSYTNVGVRSHRHPASVTCYCTRTPKLVGGHFDERAFWAKIKAQDRERRSTWNVKLASFKYQYRRANGRLRQLLSLQQSCRAGNVSVYWREPWGTQWAAPTWGLGSSICESAERNIQATRRHIRTIEAKARDEARKLRINPGEARLH